MGNRPTNLSHRFKHLVNIGEAVDKKSTQRHEDHIKSNNISDEDINVTARSENASLQESENVSSVILSSGSTSNLSVHGIQFNIPESRFNVSVKDSNYTHVGNKIHIYGSASFVNSTQSNVQIINQHRTPIEHDFGELFLFIQIKSI